MFILSACTPTQHTVAETTIVSSTTPTENSLAPIATEDSFLDIPRHPSRTPRPYSPFPKVDIYSDTIDFPSWVSDPNINVLLTNNGRYKSREQIDLILVNASTFEAYQLPKIDAIEYYFWSPDGKEIIVITKDNDLIVMNIFNGQVIISPTNNQVTITDPWSREGMIAHTSKTTPQNYTLFSPWGESRNYLSFDGQYAIKQYGTDDNALHILNLETKEETLITALKDEWHLCSSEWSPVNLTLASVQADQYYNPWLDGYEEVPNFKMQIYDIQGNNIAQYKNIPSINFSPDGTKFLYLPLDKESLVFWSSAPCIYDRLTNHTKCYNDALNKQHVIDGETGIFQLEWLQDQSRFAYNYYFYNSDTHESSGGLCFVETNTGHEQCILENFKNDYHKLVNCKFSPDENAIVFIVNIAPRSDDGGAAQFGVANAQTGEYMLFPELSIFQEIWRP